MNRRSFLVAGAAGALLPSSKPSSAGAAGTPDGRVRQEHGVLYEIPELEEFASDRLVHAYHDFFIPPPAQNEWGYCQAAKSVAGITSILFPPFACCGRPNIPTPGGSISPGDLITCELFLNGRLLSSFPLPDGKVIYQWFPHRILREMLVQGLRFNTQTFLPANQKAVAELISVKNESRQPRNLSLGFDLRAGVTYKAGTWYGQWSAGDPAEADNRLTEDRSRGCLIFESQHTRAVSVQGIHPLPKRFERGRMLIDEFALNPGEERVFQYVNAIEGEPAAALEAYNRQQSNFRQLLEENEATWRARIQAAFTTGNSEFSGHLPKLVTRDPALRKIYYAGFGDLLMSRRASPDSVYGPTFVTTPRGLSTLSYVWDTGLTSLSMALLDPGVLSRLLETWFAARISDWYATDYLSGKKVGPWYAANDLSLLQCAHNYLRVTGDSKWLEKTVEGKTILEHLAGHAMRWKQLDHFGHGLADYGTMENLLEAVSTYTGEVAALNAGNVFGMRFVGALLERQGDSARAAQFRAEAKELAARINRLLYVPGKGWWKCGQRDGTFKEVRHCYDLLTVLDAMFEDLSSAQKREMAHFFWSELHTPLWMHALSPGDADATWNPGAFAGLRSDHTWLGAYVAWPPMTAKGLYKIDSPERVTAWVKEFAKATGQGLFGQSHFVETTFPTDAGGPLKDPAGGWYEVAGGCYADMVIDSVFGADLTLYDGIQVRSRLQHFDPAARLEGLNYQGKDYIVSAQGTQVLS